MTTVLPGTFTTFLKVPVSFLSPEARASAMGVPLVERPEALPNSNPVTGDYGTAARKTTAALLLHAVRRRVGARD